MLTTEVRNSVPIKPSITKTPLMLIVQFTNQLSHSEAMEQMNVEESLKVNIDFSEQTLPKSVKELQPLLWKDADSYKCLLGPDLNDGILGMGQTPLLAIIEWDNQLMKRLSTATEDDHVIQYVKDVYKADNTEVW